MNCKSNGEKWSHWTNAFRNVAIGVSVLALTAGAFLGYQQINLHFQDPPTAKVDPAEQIKYGPPTEDEVKGLCGWAGPEVAAQEWIRGQFDKRIEGLQIVGANHAENAKRRVVLWDAAKWVNGGEHLPTIRQLIGDCVGAGATHAVNYLQTVSIVYDGRLEQYKPIYLPYHYACGRNAKECGGGRIRGPSGSIGSWQAEALRLYGVIPADLEGLPPYSRDVVSSWAVKMPDAKWIEKGRLHLVKDVAHITSVEQAIDALCNGYPLTIASDWGGIMRPPVLDGRLVNRRVTTWMHQMCVIGYDGATVPGKQYFCVLNSWGPDAHGDPPDDAPPGSFWILAEEMAYIIRQGDTFALADLQGFPQRDLDLTPLGWRQRRLRRAIVTVESGRSRNASTIALLGPGGRNPLVDYQPGYRPAGPADRSAGSFRIMWSGGGDDGLGLRARGHDGAVLFANYQPEPGGPGQLGHLELDRLGHPGSAAGTGHESAGRHRLRSAGRDLDVLRPGGSVDQVPRENGAVGEDRHRPTYGGAVCDVSMDPGGQPVD